MKWLNGYKTLLGGLLHAAWFVYYVFIEKTIDTETKCVGHAIIGVLTGVGISHKVIKNKETINNGINRAKNAFKKK